MSFVFNYVVKCQLVIKLSYLVSQKKVLKMLKETLVLRDLMIQIFFQEMSHMVAVEMMRGMKGCLQYPLREGLSSFPFVAFSNSKRT